MASNGDTRREFRVGNDKVFGVGSFHKTLPHNRFGEVEEKPFRELVRATEGDGRGFREVDEGKHGATAPLTNPQAGLAHDRLTRHPAAYAMPPAPSVLSITTAAEMTELYWMALLRDHSLHTAAGHPDFAAAAHEIDACFKDAVADAGDAGHLGAGIDAPGAFGRLARITPQNVFRMGLPGEEAGPLVSQFFVRDVAFGTQTIDQRQRPYRRDRNYLTRFDAWLDAQNRGRDAAGQSYSMSNEDTGDNFEAQPRYISTMRDLARFVNKDALHQAYFNAALLMLSGEAKWTPGNPYGTGGSLERREAGFGVLGGPHILALVSEVATRALKIVWSQKWQVHLRLRPEAYGGLVHVQTIGVDKRQRLYGLPPWVSETDAAKRVRAGDDKTLLLPMAFTAGSPTHPAYGAGHATVAGACVTILKAYFKTFDVDHQGHVHPLRFDTLLERSEPYGEKWPMRAYVTGVDADGKGLCLELPEVERRQLTIEGELNKLASNVAMGRSMGGVHWRTDNTRSLVLGEAMAAQILADVTTDVNEFPAFEFRTFARRSNGEPKRVLIRQGRIFVDGVQVDTSTSAL